MKTISVLLVEDVQDVGKKGDVVEVNDGYARNFLFRKNLATSLTKGALKAWHEKQARLAKKKANAKNDAIELKKKLEKEYKMILKEKAGKEGKLFGSVTSEVIAHQLKKDKKLSIDKKKIVMDGHIKNLGKHHVSVKLYPEVVAKITIIVESAEEE